ncbi:MAG: CHRD domain-containing protein [Actinomycetota bacterium]|nr:CHRD domain-containing protein [Actinomycetota bacterium]
MGSKTWKAAAVTAAVALSAVGTAGPAAARHGKPVRVALSGAEEVPANPHGRADRGSAWLKLDERKGQVCWRFGRLTLTAGDSLPTAAHVHRAPRGQAGPVVVPLFTTADAPATYPTGVSCVAAAPELVREIRANLSGFYVNLHNAQHPAGVVRGQLDGQRTAAKADHPRNRDRRHREQRPHR